MIFHHQWDGYLERSANAFPMIKDHVLLPLAGRIADVDSDMTRRLAADVVGRIVDLIPDDWLEDTPLFASPAEQRAAYLHYLMARLQNPRKFVEEAIRARAVHV